MLWIGSLACSGASRGVPTGTIKSMRSARGARTAEEFGALVDAWPACEAAGD